MRVSNVGRHFQRYKADVNKDEKITDLEFFAFPKRVTLADQHPVITIWFVN